MKAPPTIALSNLTWLDAERLASPLLVVPVGATEQHGPHLPLTTDTDIAIGIAEALAAEVEEAVVAPAVAYGSSGEHAGFPGTMSIGSAALELLLVELVRSATASFPRVLLISTHGGNAAAVRRAVDRLCAEGRDVQAYSPAWPHDVHAGRAETSLMLAIAPDRVRLERAEAGVLEPLAAILPRLVAEGVRAVSGNGVLGDPAGASAGEGRALLRDAVADAVTMVACLAVPA